MHAALDARPIIVALAGPKGAGKTTFYEVFLRETGLRFVNVDEISRELDFDAYTAARVAGEIRRELVQQRESFIFETVLSDPVGDEISFLRDAASSGYNVVLCYIRIPGPETSEERVAMRVSQGGHAESVPPWLASLHAAIARTLDRREHLVVACSALKRSYRDVLRGDARRLRFVYLKAAPDELSQRLSTRPDHFAGPKLLAGQLATLEEPDEMEAFTVDATWPQERIVAAIVREFGL